MKRLTSNKDVSEMGMVELAHNSCYAKDGEARYRDYDNDVSARLLARRLLKVFAGGYDAFTCDEVFDEYMADCLYDGMDSTEGLIALFYRNLWAMADLHSHLKHYEDLREQGRLPELPCAVGDTVYEVQEIRKRIQPYEVISVTISRTGIMYGWKLKGEGVYIRTDGFSDSDLGKTVFLVRKEAEEALKRMEYGNEV